MAKKVYQITTIEGERDVEYSTYHVIASTADEAIEKLTPQLNGEAPEMVEEVRRLSIIDVE